MTKLNKEQLLNSKICVLPWNHIATQPNGIVTLCCESNKRRQQDHANVGDRALNLNIDSVNDVLSCSVYDQVRKDMLDGKEPSACSRCYDNERLGLRSKRIVEIDSHFSRNDSFDTEEINTKFVELRLGNLCNLQCVSCNPMSSRITQKTFANLKELPFVKKEYATVKVDDSWTEREAFWNDLLENHQGIEKFYINGGEPTLVKSHWKFLDRLISTGKAKNIELQYNINVTNVKREYIDIWKQFKSVSLGCSIDDLGERNHFIRYPAHWDTIMKNVHLIKDSGLRLEITQTISIMNIFYVDEFYDFFDKLNATVIPNYVYEPSYLSIKHMPIVLKSKVIQKLMGKISQFHFDSILKTIGVGIENPTEFHNGLQFMRRIAELRKLDLEKIFPEYFEVINEYTPNR